MLYNIGNVSIHRSAYQAYIQNTYYATQAYKDTVLTNSGYYGDKAGFFEDCFAKYDDIEKTPNALRRAEIVEGSRWSQLTGPLFVPLFDSENLLINNVSVDIELIRNSPEFILYDETKGVDYKIEIRNPVVTVRRYKPSPPVLSSIVKSLSSSTAKYSFRNIDMKAINYAAGLTRISIPNITTGQIPSRIMFAFLSAAGFRGSYNKNPFLFKNYNLKDINVYVNSDKHPAFPITYDFSHANISMGYENFLEQLGIYQAKTNGISIREWEEGYTIFVVDLTSDLSASRDHYSLIQTGDVFAEINFSAVLSEEITCIVYSEYEKLIEIDEFRNIKSDEQI